MSNNPKLTVFYEKLRGKVFEISKEVTTVGRRDDNDVCLKDGSLSGHHAEIVRSGEEGNYTYTLRDTGSTNGTRINSAPITEQVLKNNDLIMFGSVEVLFDSNNGKGSDDATSSLGRITHTIDLNSTETMSTSPTLTSLNPLAVEDEKKKAMLHKIILGVCILFGISALAAAIFAMLKLFS